jgi:hypothetical protein
MLKVILVIPVQPVNALSPMLVALEGKFTLVRVVQFSNAAEPMLVTPPGIVSNPLGAVPLHPVIAMFVPELEKVRPLGIHTQYSVTLAVPIVKVAPGA